MPCMENLCNQQNSVSCANEYTNLGTYIAVCTCKNGYEKPRCDTCKYPFIYMVILTSNSNSLLCRVRLIDWVFFFKIGSISHPGLESLCLNLIMWSYFLWTLSIIKLFGHLLTYITFYLNHLILSQDVIFLDTIAKEICLLIHIIAL